MAEAVIPMSEVMRSVTINVRITGAKVAAARLRAGAQLIKLAALIIGCNIEIQTENDLDPRDHTTM